jgi:hypothetical protein
MREQRRRELGLLRFTYVVTPGALPVEDDGSAKAPRRVDASASDGDGGEVDQEHGEPDWERGKDLCCSSNKEIIDHRVKLPIESLMPTK